MDWRCSILNLEQYMKQISKQSGNIKRLSVKCRIRSSLFHLRRITASVNRIFKVFNPV